MLIEVYYMKDWNNFLPYSKYIQSVYWIETFESDFFLSRVVAETANPPFSFTSSMTHERDRGIYSIKFLAKVHFPNRIASKTFLKVMLWAQLGLPWNPEVCRCSCSASLHSLSLLLLFSTPPASANQSLYYCQGAVDSWREVCNLAELAASGHVHYFSLFMWLRHLIILCFPQPWHQATDLGRLIKVSMSQGAYC